MNRVVRNQKTSRFGAKHLTAGILIIFVLGYAFFSPKPRELFSKKDVAETIGSAIANGQFPQAVEVTSDDQDQVRAKVEYTIDGALQKEMEELFELYHPDYGSFVAMDARDGKILALVSFTNNPNEVGNLALKASFPAASVFKIVTAAAAIDKRLLSPDSVIPYNGKASTLYRKNVESNQTNRWTRYSTLKDAFAHSVNTVFGKIGIFYLGHTLIEEYAERFGFNSAVQADLPVEIGRVDLDQNDPWGVVEAASGFTLKNTMSPLQGATIAAAVANDGVMMEPYIVKSVRSSEGKPLYLGAPSVAKNVVDYATAAQLRTLMRETVKNGTTRKVFRTFLTSKNYKAIDLGGKSGSLTGIAPKGKCDWFVAYATDGKRPIAIAALTVHEQYWRVKSAYLVRRFVESYFDPRHQKSADNESLVVIR